jgi:hypothetical protein
MVLSSKLDNTFYQTFNSCVLASYAIASNYFTHIQVVDYFKDYCEHFSILPDSNTTNNIYTNLVAYEDAYEKHFHNELRDRGCTGYDLITYLHINSLSNSFSNSRNVIKLQQIPDCEKIKNDIITKLINEESLLLGTQCILGNVCHSSVYGYDMKGFYNIQTQQASSRVIYQTSLDDFGKLNDGVLIEKIK